MNLIPNITNPSPDYYCTWQTQLYYCSNGGPEKQRENIGEKTLLGTGKYEGWADFYNCARKDLFLVMDDSWDVPLKNYKEHYGSLVLNKEKFQSYYHESPEISLKMLSDDIKRKGWKGLGGWVCAQESSIYSKDISEKEYWTRRIKMCDYAGFDFWKVDWGQKAEEIEFRKMLTALCKKYSNRLLIEHSICNDILPECDVFRTYDVPAIMSIPRTFSKVAPLLKYNTRNGYSGIINCEDEAYFAAALGLSMGVMRHPMVGNLPDGRPDPSFPSVHRNLKTKMTEVTRAVRWHKIAPAFAVDGSKTFIDDKLLKDFWEIKEQAAEVEAWWGFKDGDTMTDQAPARISRGIDLPIVSSDEKGYVPYIAAARNPNGAVSVMTAGRTIKRKYILPLCDVKICGGISDIFGIFGAYKKLIIHTELCLDNVKIFAQDLAANEALDITKNVIIGKNDLIIPGELISKIGTLGQPSNDTSEPGMVLKLIF